MNSASSPSSSLPDPPRRWFSFRGWFLWGWVGLLVLLAVIAAGRWYNQSMLERDANHLFESILASGNVRAAHAQSDTTFQALYPLEAFEAHARRHPALLQRERLTVLSLDWKRGSGATYAVVKTRIEEEQGPSEVTFYCSQDARGNWRLAGIGPDLMAGVPAKLAPMTGSVSPRKK